MIHIYSFNSHTNSYIVSLANYAECYDRMNLVLKNASFLLTFIIV